MVNWESLLEFEEAIASSNTSSFSSSSLLLQSIEGKLIDRLNCPTPSSCQYTEEDLIKAMSLYDFALDEFTSCSKCGCQLNNTASYKSCCKNYVELKNYLSSSMERSYWVSLINNPTGTINTLPNYTNMLILQQGIPLQLRSVIWNRLLLVGETIPETSSLIYENFQHSYNQEILEQISKDLHRTFPNVEFFTLPKTVENLSTILNVYANYDAELGYCQGLLFLVGVLYYHFQDESPALTFHSLVVIMQSEPELHDIFTASTMSSTLNEWLHEFLDILKIVDPTLLNHLQNEIGIEFQVFLFQWWLSFVSSHIPDFSIINRIMDVCLTQGWKVGLFKVSLGLLVVNKPILMSLSEGDEEVIYQHLLNESRWGVAVNDLDLFFGKTLMSWDDERLFMNASEEELFKIPKPASATSSHNRSASTVMDKFKQLSVGLGLPRSDCDELSPQTASSSSSSLSVFSNRGSTVNPIHNNGSNNNITDYESVYSDITSTHSGDENGCSSSSIKGFGNTFSSYIKPFHLRSPSKVDTINESSLVTENKHMKVLLKQAMEMIEGGEKNERVLDDIKLILGL